MSSDQDNPLLLDVLTASSTSYTANPEGQTLTEVKKKSFFFFNYFISS
jgi:oligosaccharyltransferase complex subunit beta